MNVSLRDPGVVFLGRESPRYNTAFVVPELLAEGIGSVLGGALGGVLSGALRTGTPEAQAVPQQGAGVQILNVCGCRGSCDCDGDQAEGSCDCEDCC